MESQYCWNANSSRASTPCSELSAGSVECITHCHVEVVAFSLACRTSLRAGPAGQVDHYAIADTPLAAVRRCFDHDVTSLELRCNFAELSGPLPDHVYDGWTRCNASKRDLRHHDGFLPWLRRFRAHQDQPKGVPYPGSGCSVNSCRKARRRCCGQWRPLSGSDLPQNGLSDPCCRSRSHRVWWRRARLRGSRSRCVRVSRARRSAGRCDRRAGSRTARDRG